MSWTKRFLIWAFILLVFNIYEHHCGLVGEGNLPDEVEQKEKKRHLGDDFKSVDLTTNDETSAIYQDSHDPEENDGDFQGDIILTTEQKAYITSSINNKKKRGHLPEEWNAKWPQNIVNYENNMKDVDRKPLDGAIAEIESKTCISFKRGRSSAGRYVDLVNGNGCSSNIGYLNGRYQKITLGRGCNRKGVIIHELMHTLGFFHEQSREDRDLHVTIQYNNIRAGMENNFKKYDGSRIRSTGPYDYKSVMHYSSTAFSKNGKPTIVPRDPANLPLGQRDGLSDLDVQELRTYYKCDDLGVSTPKPIPTLPPLPKTTQKPAQRRRRISTRRRRISTRRRRISTRRRRISTRRRRISTRRRRISTRRRRISARRRRISTRRRRISTRRRRVWTRRRRATRRRRRSG